MNKRQIKYQKNREKEKEQALAYYWEHRNIINRKRRAKYHRNIEVERKKLRERQRARRRRIKMIQTAKK